LQGGLGITQQVALVPAFLHFRTSDILAEWLVIYMVLVGTLCGVSAHCR
jgi:hypothetical protein